MTPQTAASEPDSKTPTDQNKFWGAEAQDAPISPWRTRRAGGWGKRRFRVQIKLALALRLPVRRSSRAFQSHIGHWGELEDDLARLDQHMHNQEARPFMKSLAAGREEWREVGESHD